MSVLFQQVDEKSHLTRLAELGNEIALLVETMTGDTSVSLQVDNGEFKPRGHEQSHAFALRRDDRSNYLVRSIRQHLPDPRLIRRIIRMRRLRARFFDESLFADPAWDILLDLAASRADHTRVSVSSLCIASGVAPSTALRWIASLTDAGLLERTNDDIDRRRAFISLSEKGAQAISSYFAEIGNNAKYLI